jgi:ABC-type sugar transport system ATPase subunit
MMLPRLQGEKWMLEMGDDRQIKPKCSARPNLLDLTVMPSAATKIGTPVLEVRSLVKEFPGTRALDGVNLIIRYGEIHALLGENGAGKTTLIKTIVGALQPTAGSLLLDSEPIRFGSPLAAQQAGIAVVHQHSNLVPTLSVEENLWLGRPLPRLAGTFINWSALRRRAVEILDYVGSSTKPGAIVSDLRADERAMISIARAIASNARLIILDEPTAALLPHEVSTLFHQMRRLAQEGLGFLYVSHRLTEVLEISDVVSVLRDGRNAGSFNRASMDRKRVIAAIVGPTKDLNPSSKVESANGPVALAVSELKGPSVAGVSFEARVGEILGIAGLPGSGSEETIDLLFGRKATRGGTISLRGRILKLHDTSHAIRAGIALIPKDRLAESILAGLNVRENITIASLKRFLLGPVLGLINRRREVRAAADMGTRLGIRMTNVEASIETLSGGNQQKVVLGRWLATNATLFLMNSPTAAVDVGAKAEIYAVIRGLADGGATIIFTSTEVEEFPRLCQRVLVFHEGLIVGELTGRAVNESNIMHLSSGGSDVERIA